MHVSAILVLVAALLAGCGSLVTLDHRAVCTVARDRALAILDVGVKVAVDLNDKDRAVMCAAPPVAPPAPPASASK